MDSLHTATATARGGREGFVRSKTGTIDLPLTMPEALGGKGEDAGTNPEELFAAGYAACFESAIRLVARRRELELPEFTVTAEVSIGKDGDGFALAARVRGYFAGMDRDQADAIMAEAHEACPYSKATVGNMAVEVVAET
jgi:lipoyl-dependent peroxiredoxin